MLNATLLTIHGFWSSPATWERLSAAWHADEQLSGLQIHPFGYPSPKRPHLPFSTTRVPDYDDVAQTLATEYTVRTRARQPISRLSPTARAASSCNGSLPGCCTRAGRGNSHASELS